MTTKQISEKERNLAELYGSFWPEFDDALYSQSVELFGRRFEANGFDTAWFKGKTCLDAGCGGGRYSAAMASFGARVTGCDLSFRGLKDARQRTVSENRPDFVQSSVLELPLATSKFDFVCCSGVLHHTVNADAGAKQLFRVLKPGGTLYLLMYATGGVRWPTILAMRPICERIGRDVLEAALNASGLPANKRRMYLDDLLVPLIDFYSWQRLQTLLDRTGFVDIRRWDRGHFDQEADIEALLQDFLTMQKPFAEAAERDSDPYRGYSSEFRLLDDWCGQAIDTIRCYRDMAARGDIPEADAHALLIGSGNHRVLCKKP